MRFAVPSAGCCTRKAPVGETVVSRSRHDGPCGEAGGCSATQRPSACRFHSQAGEGRPSALRAGSCSGNRKGQRGAGYRGWPHIGREQRTESQASRLQRAQRGTLAATADGARAGAAREGDGPLPRGLCEQANVVGARSGRSRATTARAHTRYTHRGADAAAGAAAATAAMPERTTVVFSIFAVLRSSCSFKGSMPTPGSSDSSSRGRRLALGRAWRRP